MQVTLLTPTAVNDVENERNGMLKRVAVSPSGSEVNVQFQQGYSGNTAISLYDVNGICYYTQQVNVSASSTIKVVSPKIYLPVLISSKPSTNNINQVLYNL